MTTSAFDMDKTATLQLLRLASARAGALKASINMGNGNESVKCDPAMLAGLVRKLSASRDDADTISLPEGILLENIEELAFNASKDPGQTFISIGARDRFELTDARRQEFVEMGQRKAKDRRAGMEM